MFIVTVSRKSGYIELIINNLIPKQFCHWSLYSIIFKLNKKNQWESEPDCFYNHLLDYLIQNKYIINRIDNLNLKDKNNSYFCCTLILGTKSLLQCIQ